MQFNSVALTVFKNNFTYRKVPVTSISNRILEIFFAPNFPNHGYLYPVQRKKAR